MPDYTPEFVEQVLEKNKELAYGPHGLVLKQGERCLIPSGIKVDVPAGHALIAFNKSGVAVKKGLDVGACVVDVGYQGQVHISLTNPKSGRFPVVPFATLRIFPRISYSSL
jgi:dUTPase